LTDPIDIAPSEEIGSLGIKHLKRLWSATIATRSSRTVVRDNEHRTDRLLLDALGLGLQQTMQYLFQQTPAFAEFEQWVVATAGHPDKHVVTRFNAKISADPLPGSVYEWLGRIENSAPVLTRDDLSFWQENGYVVVRNAISPTDCAAAEAAIWEYSGATPGEPETWYQAADHGIMLELIQHPSLQANRLSPRIHKAFAQLWQTADLWVSADRCGFHPPQDSNHPFPARTCTGT